MRTLVISSVYPSTARSAFGIFVRERVRHLAVHCEVTVVAPVPWFPFNRWLRGRQYTGTPYAERQDGIAVYHPRFVSLPGLGKSLDGLLYFVCVLPVVAWLRRRFPFEVIDAHFGYPDGVAAVLLGKVFRTPTLVTLRGDEARLATYQLRRFQMRLALASARVITVSDSLRQVAADLGVPREHVRVIPNGVDAVVFHPVDGQMARERLGLPRDRTILVSIGGLIERKGHHRIVEILPDLLAVRRDLLLIIVGDEVGGEPSGEIIADLVRRHGLEEHVRVLPAQPHSEIPMWMAAADLFCLATRWEGWCNVLMEALACGVPVVTTRVGGNAEFVSDERDGFLVPYWDAGAFGAAILKALDTQWDREAIAARAASHGWDSVARQVIDAIHATLLGAEPPTHRHIDTQAVRDADGA